MKYKPPYGWPSTIIGLGTVSITLILIIIVVSQVDATAPILNFDPPLTEEQLQDLIKQKEENTLYLILFGTSIMSILFTREWRGK